MKCEGKPVHAVSFTMCPTFVLCVCRFGAPRFGGSRTGPLSGKKFGNPGEKLVKKKWNLDELPKFEKNFYQEHPDLARRTAVSL